MIKIVFKVLGWICLCLGIPVCAVMAILCLSPWLFDTFGQHDRVDQLGLFGDSAGFMNACFSFLAFGAVVITFIWQNRKDNKNGVLVRKSQFEHVFFNMTSTLEEIVSHLSLTDKSIESLSSDSPGLLSIYAGNDVNSKAMADRNRLSRDTRRQGRELFRYIYLEKPASASELDVGNEADGDSAVVYGIKGAVSANPDIEPDTIRDNFFEGTLDHYFRYLYRILKYVDTSKLIEDADRENYTCILRAQLSCYELLVLFFNCLGMDKNKFKHLIERYQMFNNLRIEGLPEAYSNIYPKLFIEAEKKNAPLAYVQEKH